MAERTADPGVVIEARKVAVDGTPYIVYATVAPAVVERWVIAGVCNQCGQCEIGGVGARTDALVWAHPAGVPGACIDPTQATRLDIPVRPEISHKLSACSLRGRYLAGGQHPIGARFVAAAVVDRDVPRTMR